MHPKDADGIANSVDPDQTALGAVWSGFALFTLICLSKNLGTLRYPIFHNFRILLSLTKMAPRRDTDQKLHTKDSDDPFFWYTSHISCSGVPLVADMSHTSYTMTSHLAVTT